MRILLLIIQFPPDTNPTGTLMAQLGEGLVAYGHDVSVITAFPHYEQFRVWDAYRGKLAALDHYRGMKVLRLYVYASGNKQRMMHRLFSYLSYNALATVATLLSRRDYDIILCPNGSFFTGIAAFVSGAPRRIPFIYNVQDLYPDVPVKAGQLRNRHAIMALEYMERFMYRTSAHVSVITPSFRQSLLDRGVPPEKVSVIPNFVDTSFMRPLPRQNPFSDRLDLTGKFVVTYAGNLGYVYDLETLLEAAARLRQQQDMLFLVVGNGVAKPALEEQARRLNLNNVRFLPFQPHADLPWLRASSDVQVSLYKHGVASDSMPSKVYEIMASGRTLLASADPYSDVWNLVQSTGCGICVEPQNTDSLSEALMLLYRDAARREAMAYQGRIYAEQHFSRQVVVERYHKLFRSLVH